MRSIPLLLLLAGALPAAEPKAHKDLPYAGSKDERQTLDVYAPAEGKGHPVVVWIHGGGWQAGDKKEVDKKPQAFTDRGFVFISINYRLLPKATIKEMAGDVAKAIRWVHDHARDHGGDPDTMLVMGHSAGAQLAALVCTDDSLLKAETLSLSIIKGCVPVDGDTYDVPLQIKTVEKKRANAYTRKFGDADSQKDLSPVTHVAKGKHIPPFLILHVADHPETKGQSQRLVKVLQEAGISAKAYPAEGKTHGTINSELGVPDDKPTKALWDFLETVLKKEDKPSAEAGSLRIEGAAGKPVTLTAKEWAKLPRSKVEVKGRDGKAVTYEGVSLVEVLRAGGVSFDKHPRERAAAHLVIEGADGYRAALALAEVDPKLTDRVVLLADRADGKELAERDGPYRLIVAHDLLPVRWVRQVARVSVHHLGEEKPRK
jgi:arylformamidase